jgi:hypothetical protein
MTLNIIGLFATLSINTQKNSIVYHYVSVAIFYCYAECRYAESCYAECRNAECLGAAKMLQVL